MYSDDELQVIKKLIHDRILIARKQKVNSRLP